MRKVVKVSLLVLAACLALVVGGWVAGAPGVACASVLSAVVAAVAILGGRIALRLSGAKEVTEEEEPELHEMVARIALASELPKPRVAVVKPQAGAAPTEVLIFWSSPWRRGRRVRLPYVKFLGAESLSSGAVQSRKR